CRVLHGAGHRPRVIDALVGAESDSEVRHEAERRLQADDSAERRRDADGATLVAAEGDVHLAGGHGRPGPRRRSAGDVLAIVRVERPTVVADGAAGAGADTQDVHTILA